MDLSGKNVIITGGLGSIGVETCKQLLSRNVAQMVIIDLVENREVLDSLNVFNKKTELTFCKCDITNKSSVKETIEFVIEKIKFIDVLINNAGVVSDRNVELTINVNLIGLINVTLEALPYMDRNRYGRGGVVLNVASVLGLEPCGSLCIYSASKFGVVGFTRSLANSYYYNLTGVAAITICPGITDSPLRSDITKNDTFEYSKPLTEKFMSSKTQTADKAGEHIVRAIESNKNASIWISDLGKLVEVAPKEFWKQTN